MSASLGIDIGLSGVRASVMREDGTVVATARVSMPPTIREGIVEHDPNTWVVALLDVGSRAVEAGGIRVDAIGVTALGPAPILIGANGRALAPTPLFGLDRRADDRRARLGTGPDHALPTLLRWLETEPELTGSARTVLDAAGFVVRWLTGVESMDRITAESYRWPGYDVPVASPPPAEPDTSAGGLLAPLATTLGIVAGTPVTVGTIDCFADVAAAGVSAPGQAAVVLGSTMVLYTVAGSARAPRGLETSSHLGEGVLVGGSTATAGLALDWLIRVLGVDDRARLIELAGLLEPGSAGLTLPYLAGERTPLNDPSARGVVAGLTLATRPDHLYRSMVDGIATATLEVALRLEEAGLGPERWRVAGGGVRDETWLRATCDALGSPLEAMPDPGAATGAGWLALRMIGAEPRRDPERVVEPDPGRHAVFCDLAQRSRELWEAAGPIVRTGGSPDDRPIDRPRARPRDRSRDRSRDRDERTSA